MSSTLIYICAFGLALGFLILQFIRYQNRRALQEKLDASTAQITKPAFRCVEIKAGEHACEHVKSLENKRILVDFAPLLPLSNCDVEACNCSYTRFDDRRSGDDRRLEAEGKTNKQVMAYGNKRYAADRRRNSIKELLVDTPTRNKS